MPYGSGRRYKRLNKQVPVTPQALPTYICGHCKKLKSAALPFIDITAMDKGQLFVYTKICGDCSKLFREWTGQ